MSIPPKWFEIFAEICGRSQGALEWGLPEGWVHAELFATLKKQTPSTGWIPFPNRVPYVTWCPIDLPKKRGRDWRVTGALEWVNLCLHSPSDNHWCWFQVTVLPVSNSLEALKDAVYAFMKDLGGLIGFDIYGTAEVWEYPSKYTKGYRFDAMLEPHVELLRTGHHHFLVAFLQYCLGLEHWAWDENQFIDTVRNWLICRQGQAGHERLGTDFGMNISQRQLSGEYSLILAEIKKNDRSH